MTNTLSRTIADEKINRIIAIESRGDPNARPPKGTAGGLGQFLVGTWDEVGQKHYPKQKAHYGKSWTGMRLGAANATIQLLMLARLVEDNAAAMDSSFNGDLYLAHFLGVGAARRFVRSAQEAPVLPIVGQKAIDNNGKILRGKTVGEVRAWAARSMAGRWDSLGQPDYVAKWYDPDKAAAFLAIGSPARAPEPQPEPTDDGDETPIKPEDRVPVPAPRPPSAPQSEVRGDPDLWLVQSMLKKMYYPPGGLDGQWGGMTAGALAGFMNDRNMEIPPPTSMEAFNSIKEELKDELRAADAEGFVRPVAPERANPTDKKVKEIAPETAPVQRTSSLGLWGLISTTVVGIYHWLSDQVSSVWDFFTENEDKIPDSVKDPNWLWEHVTQIPATVWFVVVAVAFGFVWLNSRSAVAKIVEDIKTGVRK